MQKPISVENNSTNDHSIVIFLYNLLVCIYIYIYIFKLNNVFLTPIYNTSVYFTPKSTFNSTLQKQLILKNNLSMKCSTPKLNYNVFILNYLL